MRICKETGNYYNGNSENRASALEIPLRHGHRYPMLATFRGRRRPNARTDRRCSHQKKTFTVGVRLLSQASSGLIEAVCHTVAGTRIPGSCVPESNCEDMLKKADCRLSRACEELLCLITKRTTQGLVGSRDGCLGRRGDMNCGYSRMQTGTL